MDPERLLANYFLRPMVELVRLVFWPVLEPLNRIIARNNQRKLKGALRTEMPFLFAQHRGRFVPNTDVPYPPSFDYAFATVAVDNIFIRFCSGRGELDIRIAPAGSPPPHWCDFLTVLACLDEKTAFEPPDELDMPLAASLLESTLSFITKAFDRDPNFSQRLANAQTDERVQIKETEWHLNRRF